MATSPRTRVELRLRCAGLKNKDILSKSDPLVAVYTLNRDEEWKEIGRTEQIQNSLDPEFTAVIETDYVFEEVLKMKFAVYDIDNATATLADDDYLGAIETTLGEVVSNSPFTKPLQIKGQQSGTITVTAEEQCSVQNVVNLSFNGRGLDNKDFFGKSDPFLELYKENSDGSFTLVHRTEVVMNNLNPHWVPFTITTSSLCGNDENRNIKVKCYDWDSDGSHDLIGDFNTSYHQLSTAPQGTKLEWKLINEKKKMKKKNYSDSGTITMETFKITRLYSFLEYIMSGCQINFTVAIDFTASNGDPKTYTSLHYINPSAPSEYLLALRSVGEVCQDYDTDKLFPAFGFGALVNGLVSHEFPLNGNASNPYCSGVEGIVEAYQRSIESVKLYGPTNMAPIINHVANFAEASVAKGDYQNYYVLLILTDGEISDMLQTKRAIIRGSALPMSVIIVGVGGCSFTNMIELDGDDGRLRDGPNYAVRDIVQFVPFRKAYGAGLAQAVLAEVPQQLVEYMKIKGVVPKNAATVSQ